MKKWIAVMMCSVFAAALLCGCSQQSTKSANEDTEASSAVQESAPAESNDSLQQSNAPLQGIVNAVDGDTITVQIMDRDSHNPGGPDEEGTAPDGQPEGRTALSDTPEGGNANGNGSDESEPGGQGMPQGQPDGGSAPAGEEVTITVTSDTKISMDENGTETEASINDIAVGCMIGITYEEEGKSATEIIIYQTAGQMPVQESAG